MISNFGLPILPTFSPLTMERGSNAGSISPPLILILDRVNLDGNYCTLGWSDLALYCDFGKGTSFCRSGIFLGAQFQKIGKIGGTRGKVLFFFKSQGP